MSVWIIFLLSQRLKTSQDNVNHSWGVALHCLFSPANLWSWIVTTLIMYKLIVHKLMTSKCNSCMFVKKDVVVMTIVINSVPFRPECPKFFVPVCKLVSEYPSFHLRSNFGPFQSIPANSGRDANFGRYRIWPIINLKKKKSFIWEFFWWWIWSFSHGWWWGGGVNLVLFDI